MGLVWVSVLISTSFAGIGEIGPAGAVFGPTDLRWQDACQELMFGDSESVERLVLEDIGFRSDPSSRGYPAPERLRAIHGLRFAVGEASTWPPAWVSEFGEYARESQGEERVSFRIRISGINEMAGLVSRLDGFLASRWDEEELEESVLRVDPSRRTTVFNWRGEEDRRRVTGRSLVSRRWMGQRSEWNQFDLPAEWTVATASRFLGTDGTEFAEAAVLRPGGTRVSDVYRLGSVDDEVLTTNFGDDLGEMVYAVGASDDSLVAELLAVAVPVLDTRVEPSRRLTYIFRGDRLNRSGAPLNGEYFGIREPQHLLDQLKALFAREASIPIWSAEIEEANVRIEMGPELNAFEIQGLQLGEGRTGELTQFFSGLIEALETVVGGLQVEVFRHQARGVSPEVRAPSRPVLATPGAPGAFGQMGHRGRLRLVK